MADDGRYISAEELVRIDPASAAQVYAEHVRRVCEREASAPPAEVMPTEDVPTRCAFCRAEPAEWGYPVDDAAYCGHSQHGHSRGFPMLVCGRCAGLFDEGQDERLVQRFADALTAEDVEHFDAAALSNEVRSELVALHAAVGSRVGLIRPAGA